MINATDTLLPVRLMLACNASSPRWYMVRLGLPSSTIADLSSSDAIVDKLSADFTKVEKKLK